MSRAAFHRGMDVLFTGLVRISALTTLFVFLSILTVLVIWAWPAISRYHVHFWTHSAWDPVKNDYGGLAMVYGTLASSLIALVIAVPLSLGIAIFLTELAPRFLRKPLGMAIELLAAIPSVVYGMWGLFTFGPVLVRYVQIPLQQAFQGIPYLNQLVSGVPVGIGIFPAGVVLAIMILPFITCVIRDVFELAPVLSKEAAYGLGATTWEVISKIVLPHAKVGVVGGVMLGLGRALGETMAVTFVIGNMSQLRSLSWFDAASSMTSVLANEFAEADPGLHRASLMYLALMLFFITFIVLALSKALLARLERREGK